MEREGAMTAGSSPPPVEPRTRGQLMSAAPIFTGLLVLAIALSNKAPFHRAFLAAIWAAVSILILGDFLLIAAVVIHRVAPLPDPNQQPQEPQQQQAQEPQEQQPQQ